jgi:hypothetical protein
MRPMWISTACIGGLVALSLACSGDSATTPGRAVALSVVSGDQQKAAPNTELPQPLVVRVTDGDGQPVQGQVVNFRVTSGGGSMFAGAGSTNAQGIVQDRWTLGPGFGPQTAEARAVDNTTGAPIVFATFTAAAVDNSPPAFATYQVVSGGSQSAVVGTHLPDPVVFLVRDQRGQPLPGFTFTLRSLYCGLSNGFSCFSTAGDDQLSNATLTTGPDGTAAFTGWTFSHWAGTKCLGFYPGTAPPRSDVDLGVGNPVCAEALPGPLAKLVLVSKTTSCCPLEVSVTTQDEFGNPLLDQLVTFTPSPGGTASPATDRTRTIPVSHTIEAATSWQLGPDPNTLTITSGPLSLVVTP